ncbi:MAG: hypothetical protein JWL76_2284 [Thermoleophilia bacterium]|nr:hypothetical protein [Thermoleophilia bacterium]
MRDPTTFKAFGVAVEFRALHVEPLNAVALDLRDLVRTNHHAGAHFGQRLKRMSRMIDKITLHRTGLERLQDIGGCRAVLRDYEQVQRVADEIVEAFGAKDVSNYLERPRDTGYRAIHIVHERDGRLIELQLRSPAQHRWAEVVEKAEEITGHPLKDGEGPEELLEYFRVAAGILALEESGNPPDTGLADRLRDLREQIRPYYRDTGRQR